MTWLLVRNVDSDAIPTLETWKKTLNDRLIPEAQAFMVQNPYTERQYLAYERYRLYRIAKDAIDNGKAGNAESVAQCLQRISDYEKDPETKEDIELSTKLNTEFDKHQNAKFHYWKYHTHILMKEKDKDDKTKQDELDSVKARIGKVGDIVDVYPDDKVVTNPPVHPFWSLVKVNGLAVEDARKYTMAHLDETDPLNPVMIAKRKFRLKLDSLPVNLKNNLAVNRYAEVDWSVLRNHIEDKVTGLTE